MHRAFLILVAVMVVAAGAAAVENKDPGTQASGERQGSIGAGDAVFNFNSLGSGDAVLVDFLGDGVTDQAYQDWWYWRAPGGPSEASLAWPAFTEDYTGDTATFTWVDVGGLFDATLVVTLTDGVDPGAASTLWAMTITNVSGEPLDLELFNYLDADVDGSAGTDSATLLTANSHMQITDGASMVEFRALDPSDTAYQVTSFSTLRGMLSDAAADNLDNTGLPFGPADFTGAFQWSLFGIPDSGSVDILAVVSIDEPAVPVELMTLTVE